METEELITKELFRPAPDSIGPLCRAILERHGAGVVAIVFYGSCLRDATREGVLDFYVVVDRYADAYRERRLAWANAAYPPNVFYLEVEARGEPLRAKYAVLSLRDLARGARGETLRSGIWARFCQPVQVIHARDAAARQVLTSSVSDAMHTAVREGLTLLPDDSGTQRFESEAFWKALFRDTYSAELRPERPDAVARLHAADPERYERILRSVLTERARDGELQLSDAFGKGFTVSQPARRLARARLRRRVRRPLAKTAYLFQLLKTAFTFGDWLPYVLWKLERHGGERRVPSESQRRHPLLLGWPLLLRALWQRDLR